MAWIPNLTTLDLSGNAYRPYGEAGVPFTPYGSVIGGGDSSQSTTQTGGTTATTQTQRSPLIVGGTIAALTVGGFWAYKKFIKRA